MSPASKYFRIRNIANIILLSATTGYGQTSFIHGIVLDNLGHPLARATARLRNINDVTKDTTVETSANGLFSLVGIDSTPSELHISHVGYQEFIQAIRGNGGPDSGRVDTFRLQPEGRTLPEVQVTAGKPFMVIEGEKKVFNVDRMGGVASGNAGDVMQSVPLLSVDNNGNVTIRGQTANVLVDGKPSPFSDIATTLEMIQATSIDKIEVITNPSAKYDAEGQGGIVNIILKKNTENGFHGVLNLDEGTLPDEHAGTDLSYRNKHLHLYGNVNYHSHTIDGHQTIEQYFANGDSAYELSQAAQSHLRNSDLDARLGLDLVLNDRTTLSITQTYAHHEAHRDIGSHIDSGAWYKASFPFAFNSTNTQISNRNYTATTELVHKFVKAGEQLDASLTYASNVVITAPHLRNNSKDSLSLENSRETSAPDLWTAQADYVLPIGKGKLEAGYKGEFRSGNDNVNAFTGNSPDAVLTYSSALSSQFTESSTVQALYTTWSGNIKTIHYSAGARAEYATESGNSHLQQASILRQFFNLFPSIYLSKDLANDQNIGISFATRITRPAFTQLLPYVNNSNPLNYTSGNPGLSPAYTRNVEINYNRSFARSGNFLSFSAYYSRTGDNIQPVTQKDSNGATLTRPENIGNSQKAGSDLIYRFRLWHAVHFTTTVDGSYTKFLLQAGYWSASLKLTGEINLPVKLSLLARGELSTPQALPQGYSNTIKGIDLELRRLFAKGRITAALILADALNDREESSHIRTPVFQQQEYYKENTRMLHLHLSYRL